MRFRSAWTMTGLLAATVVLAVAVASPVGAQDSKQADSVLKIGWAQDPQTLNPFVGLDEEDFTAWAINWDLLVNFSPKDFSPVPGIAQSWDVSPDKKTVTFHLDPNAEWSDGKPITSADVKYSLDTLGSQGALFTSYTDNVTQDRDARRQDGRDQDQPARHPDRGRPVHLHPAQAHLGQGADQ